MCFKILDKLDHFACNGSCYGKRIFVIALTGDITDHTVRIKVMVVIQLEMLCLYCFNGSGVLKMDILMARSITFQDAECV